MLVVGGASLREPALAHVTPRSRDAVRVLPNRALNHLVHVVTALHRQLEHRLPQRK